VDEVKESEEGNVWLEVKGDNFCIKKWQSV